MITHLPERCGKLYSDGDKNKTSACFVFRSCEREVVLVKTDKHLQNTERRHTVLTHINIMQTTVNCRDECVLPARRVHSSSASLSSIPSRVLRWRYAPVR